jgi:hypothetical protein
MPVSMPWLHQLYILAQCIIVSNHAACFRPKYTRQPQPFGWWAMHANWKLDQAMTYDPLRAKNVVTMSKWSIPTHYATTCSYVLAPTVPRTRNDLTTSFRYLSCGTSGTHIPFHLSSSRIRQDFHTKHPGLPCPGRSTLVRLCSCFWPRHEAKT